MSDQEHAVVLLSGGLDSTTCLAIAKSEGYRCSALSFDYGQRQRVELYAAAKLADLLGAEEHIVMQVDIGKLGGSALTDPNTEVPKDSNHSATDIPSTYVPARNTVFLAHALALAEVRSAFNIFIGVNAVDYSGYPDCRPEYIDAFEKLANLATAAAVEGRGQYRVRAPLLHLSKADIVRQGTALGIDYSLTHSCYDPVDFAACGHCDACILRRQGFEAAEFSDPTIYTQNT